jgi:hypothetical protein
MQKQPEIEGLEPVDDLGYRYGLAQPEVRAILIAQGVQIHALKVSRRKIDLVNPQIAQAALSRHLIQLTPATGESYTPLTDRLEQQARALDDLRSKVKELAATLSVNRAERGAA